MNDECYNSVVFKGKRVSELIEAFKVFESHNKTSILQKIIDTPNTKRGSLNPFYDITVSRDRIGFYSSWSPSVLELIAICKEFEVDFRLRYEEPNKCLYGLGVYLHQKEDYNFYELSENEIARIIYNEIDEEGEVDTCGTCILEGIEYYCDTEAFNVLLERKARELNLDFVYDFIEKFVTTEYNANPLCEKGFFHYYDWKIIILKLEELIIKNVTG